MEQQQQNSKTTTAKQQQQQQNSNSKTTTASMSVQCFALATTSPVCVFEEIKRVCAFNKVFSFEIYFFALGKK